MSNYISRARLVFGGCVLAGLLAGPACSAEAEDVGALQQPLLCQSVAICDDGDPCTDDLCVANLCVNTPLLNCVSGAGGAGAGGADGGGAGSTTGGKAQGGKSGASGGSAGGHSVTDGGNGGDPGSGAPAVGGLASSGEGVIDSGGKGTSHAGQPTVPGGEAGATGQVGTSDETDWRMQGGGCTLPGAGPPGGATPWAVLALLLGHLGARRRRQRGRADGAPGS